METDNQTNSAKPRLSNRQQLSRQARKIVNNYALLAGGLGLVPIPSIYQVAVSGLLGKMLYDLSELYGTNLTKQKNKAIIAAVLGGAHSEWITVYLGNNFKKVLPDLVAIGTSIARPAVAAGITYTIGRLFIKHFDNGAWLRQ